MARNAEPATSEVHEQEEAQPAAPPAEPDRIAPQDVDFSLRIGNKRRLRVRCGVESDPDEDDAN